jgi:hypothetical protein
MINLYLTSYPYEIYKQLYKKSGDQYLAYN